MEAVASAPKHINQIDGLRAVAILMVFVHHAFDAPLLWIGVDLFFILSGFLITQILVRDCDRFGFGTVAMRFYLRRAQRILPAYAVFMVAAVLLVPVAWSHLWPWYAFFAQNVPLAFGWIPLSPLDPLWSLGVENQFYLVWPLVVFFLPRRWLAPGMVALLVGEPLLRYVCTPMFATAAPIYALTPFRLDSLAAGALFALTLPNAGAGALQRLRWLSPVVMVLTAAALVGLTVHYPWFRRTTNVAIYNSLAYSLNILCLAALFCWAYVARAEGWLVRTLSSRPLAALGRISYMFYLSHIFFLYYAGKLVHGRGKIAVLGFVLATAFSWLSWVLLEKPCLEWRRKPAAPQESSGEMPLAA